MMTLAVVSTCNVVANDIFCPPLSPGYENPSTLVSWTERRLVKKEWHSNLHVYVCCNLQVL